MQRIFHALARSQIRKNGMDVVMKPPRQLISDTADFRYDRVVIHNWKLPSILRVFVAMDIVVIVSVPLRAFSVNGFPANFQPIRMCGKHRLAQRRRERRE